MDDFFSFKYGIKYIIWYNVFPICWFSYMWMVIGHVCMEDDFLMAKDIRWNYPSLGHQHNIQDAILHLPSSRVVSITYPWVINV